MSDMIFSVLALCMASLFLFPPVAPFAHMRTLQADLPLWSNLHSSQRLNHCSHFQDAFVFFLQVPLQDRSIDKVILLLLTLSWYSSSTHFG